MKKKLAISLAAFALMSGLIIGGISWNKSHATEEPPIVTEVNHLQDVANNHEGRITNTENDVKDLQNKTSTPPSSSNTIPPPVNSTPPAQPIYTPPAPTTVTAFEQIPNGDSEIDCKLTYSDGTTYTFKWQTWEYNQGTKITQTSGKCDSSAIGRQKSTDSYSGYQ